MTTQDSSSKKSKSRYNTVEIIALIAGAFVMLIFTIVFVTLELIVWLIPMIVALFIGRFRRLSESWGFFLLTKIFGSIATEAFFLAIDK